MVHIGPIMISIISLCQLLSSFFPVKFSSQDVSAFDKHNVIMPMFVVTIVIHATAMAIEHVLKAQKSKYQTTVANIHLLTGSLAVVLLVMILVPYYGFLLLSLWICVLTWVAWNSYQEFYEMLREAFHQLKRLIEDAFHKLKKPLEGQSYENNEINNELPRNVDEPTQSSVEKRDTPPRLELEGGDNV